MVKQQNLNETIMKTDFKEKQTVRFILLSMII